MVTLSTAKTVGWVFILLYTLGLLVYCFWAPTASTFENTYERNYKPTDQFYSQRWSPQFFYIGSVTFWWLVPLTLAFALDDTEGSKTAGGTVFRRFIFHFVVLTLLLIWFSITTLIFGSINWSQANRPEASNAYNPANDDRWCCFYYTFETGCFTKQPCNVGGAPADLKTNGLFLFEYWFSVAYILLTMVDILLVAFLIAPAFRRANVAASSELNVSLLSSNSNSAANKLVAYRSKK
jgi:hypothetical protein